MFADAVVEFTNTTGVGSYNLTGAVGTKRNFGQDFASGASVVYFAQVADGSKWEQGRGVLTISGTRTLTRAVTKSSSGGAAVNWTAGDVSAGIYVFSIASADVLGGFTRGNRQTTQPFWQQPGGSWHDNSTAGREVEWYMTASGALTEKGRLDTAFGIWMPNPRRPWVAVGAANRVVTVAEMGYNFIFDGVAASRTLTLPSAATAGAGWEIYAVVDSHAFYLNIQPQAGDPIEYGSPGAIYTVGPRLLVRIVNQGTAWRVTPGFNGRTSAQVFATPGAFTYGASPFTKFVMVECIGGGGGGGGAVSAGATEVSPGAGGGGGGYSRRVLNVNQVNNQTITVGAGGAQGTSVANGGNGGASSLGSLVVAPGGSGGSSMISGALGTNGGLGGAGGTGDFTAAGWQGGCGIKLTLGFGLSCVQAGFGGGSYIGGGGASFVSGGASANGNGGAGYGAGGGGGIAIDGTAIGGLGSSGLVVITEIA